MMKKLSIAVSINGWEYSQYMTFRYKDSYEFIYPDEEDQIFFKDRSGKPSPCGVVVDGVEIILDDGFEVLK